MLARRLPYLLEHRSARLAGIADHTRCAHLAACVMHPMVSAQTDSSADTHAPPGLHGCPSQAAECR
eukprot:m.999347 g.999347  ORF g.999347 m.999347 type:complete len:66 (-) comp24026_c0_seq35:1977-2174(-)